MKWLIKLWEFIRCCDCPSCNTRGVYFSHTEHFTPGEPDVYICKNCKKEFV